MSGTGKRMPTPDGHGPASNETETPSTGRERVIARCRACDSVYTAWTWPSGRVSIVGRGHCTCGSSDMAVLDGA